MSGHTPGPLEVRAVLSESPMELCAATIHGPNGAELGCTWRRVDDPPGADALPGIENALLWAAAPELADALEIAISALGERHAFTQVVEAIRIGKLALTKAGRRL